MKAFLLKNNCNLNNCDAPLEYAEVPMPVIAENDILIRVTYCGICHTEMDEIEGRVKPAFLPIIPGHQAVGIVHETGKFANRFSIGDKVGVSWIYSSCGNCSHCEQGNENLCPNFKGTGKDANGGYAEFMVINENYAFKIPDNLPDEKIAPLMCAGAIG